MARWLASWIERTPKWAIVEADSEKEAILKTKEGKLVEGTQDSDPGKMDKRSVQVMRSPYS